MTTKGIILAILVCVGSMANAQCAGVTSCSALTCDENNVATALGTINTDGTVLSIPAGTCSWVTKLSYTQTNSFTLQGAGAQYSTGGPSGSVAGSDQTIIVDNDTGHAADNALLAITLSSANKSLRITGIDWQWGTACAPNQCPTPGNGEISLSGTCGGVTACNQVRIDHNHEDATALKVVFTHWGGWINGVVDHNYLASRGTLVSINMGNMGSETDGSGNTSWNTATNLGSSNFQFIEDNYEFAYQVNTKQGGALNDCDHGGRTVVRYNHMAPGTFDAHEQAGGTSRGCRAWEMYGNNIDYTTQPGELPQGQVANVRAGTGVVWGNTVNNVGSAFVIASMDRLQYLSGTFGGFPPNGYGSCLGTAKHGFVNTDSTGKVVTWVSGDHFDTTWIIPQGPSPSGPVIDINGFNHTGIASVPSTTTLTLTVAVTANQVNVPYHTGSIWDGNTTNMGYPCLDQVGRGIGDLITGSTPSVSACTATNTGTFPGAINCTVTLAGGPGGLAVVTSNNNGTGYAIGDVLNVAGGTGTTGQLAPLLAANIGASGALTGTLSVGFPGTGYSTGTGVATSGGSGSGGTVNIVGLAAFPHEALEPFYVFANTVTGASGLQGVTNDNFSVFAANVDYYKQFGTGFQAGSNCILAACNGANAITVGVNDTTGAARAPVNGSGNDACTAGVGWWNPTTQTLYKCGPANTWTSYYTPYTYPHPLQGSTSPATAPTFLPLAGSYMGMQWVFITTTNGTVVCYNATGTPGPHTDGNFGCASGSILYTGPILITTGQSFFAVAGGSGFSDSSVASAVYTISGIISPVEVSQSRSPITLTPEGD